MHDIPILPAEQAIDTAKTVLKSGFGRIESINTQIITDLPPAHGTGSVETDSLGTLIAKATAEGGYISSSDELLRRQKEIRNAILSLVKKSRQYLDAAEKRAKEHLAIADFLSGEKTVDQLPGQLDPTMRSAALATKKAVEAGVLQVNPAAEIRKMAHHAISRITESRSRQDATTTSLHLAADRARAKLYTTILDGNGTAGMKFYAKRAQERISGLVKAKRDLANEKYDANRRKFANRKARGEK